MATRIASGQITIVDLNDGKALQAFTSTSQGDTQIYNPDENTYTPNYANSPYQVVTAHVYVTGNPSDVAGTSACTAWSWKVNGTAVSASTSGMSAAANVLTLKNNIAKGSNFYNIEWSCTHTDDNGAQTTVRGYKTINLTKTGGTLAVVQITQPKGDTFNAGNNVTSLTAVAKLYRGNNHDTSVSAMTWKRLNISTGEWVAVSTGVSTSGGVSTLTVAADDVLNFQTFMCEVKDTDGTYSSIVTFFDMTDPYTVEVYTLTGDKIVNGAGNTTVYARVWRGATLVESADAKEKQFTYTWTKYDKNGATTNWNGTTQTTKTGNPITVAAADVNVKATIVCEVSK